MTNGEARSIAGTNWTNLTYEARMRVNQRGTDTWNTGRFLFHYKDACNYYALIPHADSTTLELAKNLNCVWSANLVTTGMGSSTYAYAWNTYMMDVTRYPNSSVRIVVSVNGTEQFTYTDAASGAIPYGHIGFYLDTGSGNTTKVDIDDVKVSASGAALFTETLNATQRSIEDGTVSTAAQLADGAGLSRGAWLRLAGGWNLSNRTTVSDFSDTPADVNSSTNPAWNGLAADFNTTVDVVPGTSKDATGSTTTRSAQIWGAKVFSASGATWGYAMLERVINLSDVVGFTDGKQIATANLTLDWDFNTCLTYPTNGCDFDETGSHVFLYGFLIPEDVAPGGLTEEDFDPDGGGCLTGGMTTLSTGLAIACPKARKTRTAGINTSGGCPDTTRFCFDWVGTGGNGTGSPDSAVYNDTFAVRWEGKINFPSTGTYYFYLNADDGGALFIDSKPVALRWSDGAGNITGSIAITDAGLRDIRIEFYENTGNASINLTWEGPGVAKELVPFSSLYRPSGIYKINQSGAGDYDDKHLYGANPIEAWDPSFIPNPRHDAKDDYTISEYCTDAGLQSPCAKGYLSDFFNTIGAGSHRYKLRFYVPAAFRSTLTQTEQFALYLDDIRLNLTYKDDTPPSAVTGLKSPDGVSQVNWSWTNPSDSDLSYVEVYLNGQLHRNVTAQPGAAMYFNATLPTGVSYQIDVRSVDMVGNVNTTNVSGTALSLSQGDLLLQEDFNDEDDYGWNRTTTGWNTTGGIYNATGAAPLSLNGNLSWANGSVEARMRTTAPGPDPFNTARLIARYNATGWHYYTTLTNHSPPRLQIYKTAGGTPSLLASTTGGSLDPTAWHTVRLNATTLANGSTKLDAYLDGATSPNLTVVDGTASVIASGQMGLMANQSTAEFDDVKAKGAFQRAVIMNYGSDAARSFEDGNTWGAGNCTATQNNSPTCAVFDWDTVGTAGYDDAPSCSNFGFTGLPANGIYSAMRADKPGSVEPEVSDTTGTGTRGYWASCVRETGGAFNPEETAGYVSINRTFSLGDYMASGASVSSATLKFDFKGHSTDFDSGGFGDDGAVIVYAFIQDVDTGLYYKVRGDQSGATDGTTTRALSPVNYNGCSYIYAWDSKVGGTPKCGATGGAQVNPTTSVDDYAVTQVCANASSILNNGTTFGDTAAQCTSFVSLGQFLNTYATTTRQFRLWFRVFYDLNPNSFSATQQFSVTLDDARIGLTYAETPYAPLVGVSGAPGTSTTYSVDSNGFIRDWLLLNFTGASGACNVGTNAETIPERNATPYPGLAQSGKTWFVNHSASSTINLDTIIGGDTSYAYAFAYVWSPANQGARLRLGSDDGIMATLDGVQVWNNSNACRGQVQDQDSINVTLVEGWNTLLLKSTENSGAWSFIARFTTPDGLTNLTNLTISLGEPAGWNSTAQTARVYCADGSSAGCDATTYRLLTYSTNPGACPADYAAYTSGSPATVTDRTWVCATAEDIAGNAGFSEPVEFRVAIPPEWANQAQNASSISAGGSIDLSAQGRDETGLAWATLATNETGTWTNWTSKHGSPLYLPNSGFYRIWDYSISSLNQTQINDLYNLSIYGLSGSAARAVYNDSNYPTSWVSASATASIVNNLTARGFTVRNASQLKTWMDANGPDSVVVLAKDLCPDTVCEANASNATIRQYMNRSGRVVWLGDVPFYYQGLSGGGTVTWAFSGQQSVLGLSAPNFLTRTASLTDQGKRYGLTQTWQSLRPNPLDGITEVLAYDNGSTGNASAYHIAFNTTSWTWANFTWQNVSVPAGTTVGWRIYFNDSAGNENVTDILAFTVTASSQGPVFSNTSWNQSSVSPNAPVRFNATIESATTVTQASINVTYPNATTVQRSLANTSVSLGNNRYNWTYNETSTSAAGTYTTVNVSALNSSGWNASTLSGVTFTVTSGGPPTGTSITYTAGWNTTTSYWVGFDNGTGATWNNITSQQAALSGGTCGAYSPTGTPWSLNISNVPSPQTLSITQGRCFRIAINASNSNGWNNQSGGVVQVDTTAPTGGSISYVDGFYSTGSVSITFTNSSDPESGINANYIDRRQTTLGNGVCNSFGSNWTNLTTNVTSPYSATGLSSGQCYQFKMRTRNGALINSSDITSASVAKVDTSAPSGGAITYPNGENEPDQAAVTFDNGTDSESGIISVYIYRRETARSGPGTCNPFAANWTLRVSDPPSSPWTDAGLTDNTCFLWSLNTTNGAGLWTNYSSSNVYVNGPSPTGTLVVSINATPATQSVPRNTTFTLNATVTCTGPAGASCGRVNGTARYNATGTEPNTVGETDAENSSAQPFKISDDAMISLSETDANDWFGTNNLQSVVKNTNNGLIYIAGDGGRFGAYNSTTNISTDLSGVVPWISGGETVGSLVYDSANNRIYIGIGTAVGKFGVYYAANNTSVNLSQTDTGDWIGTKGIGALAYDSTRQLVYLATGVACGQGFFGAHNITTNVTEDLSSTLPWGTGVSLHGLTYNAHDDRLYISGGSSCPSTAFGAYNRTSNTTVNLAGTLPSDWNGNYDLDSMAYDSSEGTIYIVGGTGSGGSKMLLGRYNYTTNTTINLTPTTPWGGVNGVLSAVAYDSLSKAIYVGGSSGNYGRYNSSTNITTDLSAIDPGNWVGTTVVRYMEYDANESMLYTSFYSGKFGRYLGGNPRTCGVLKAGESCTLNFTVNASGAPADYALDVNFRSNNTVVAENNTSNAAVTITPPPAPSITSWYNNRTSFFENFSSGTIDTTKLIPLVADGNADASTGYLNLSVTGTGGTWRSRLYQLNHSTTGNVTFQALVRINGTGPAHTNHVSRGLSQANATNASGETRYQYAIGGTEQNLGFNKREYAKVYINGGPVSGTNLGPEIADSWEAVRIDVTRIDPDQKKFEAYRNGVLKNTTYWNSTGAGNWSVSFDIHTGLYDQTFTIEDHYDDLRVLDRRPDLSVVQGQAVRFNASADQSGTWTWKVNDAVKKNSTTAANDEFDYAFYDIGSFAVNATVANANGTTANLSWTVAVASNDTTLPTIAINAPASNFQTNTNISVNVSVGDGTGSGVAYAEASLKSATGQNVSRTQLAAGAPMAGPAVVWNYTENPSGSSDVALSVAVDSSGVTYVAGWDSTGGGIDRQWRVRRIFPNGTADWLYTENLGANPDDANGVAIGSSGVYVAGYDESLGLGNGKIRVRKLFFNGTADWLYTENPSGGIDRAHAVALDLAENLYLAASDESQGGGNDQWHILKLYANGTLAWNNTQNPSGGSDRLLSIALDSSGNIYAAGYYNNGGSDYGWGVTKLYPNGTWAWNWSENPSGLDDEAMSVAVDSAGDVYAFGYSYATGDLRFRLVKLYSNGTVAWNWDGGATGGQGRSVVLDSSGNIYAAGKDSIPGNNQWRVAKLYPNGTLAWNWTENPSGASDETRSITVDASGNLYVAGADGIPGNDQWRVVKLLPSGNFYTGTVPITALADGNYTLYVNATDAARNSLNGTNTTGYNIRIDRAAPASVTGLITAGGVDFINWTWTNPGDSDFNHTEVWVNGSFVANVSVPYYNRTGLTPNVSVAISLRTGDVAGNVNATWVNSTAYSSAAAPTALSVVAVESNRINLSWSNATNPSGTEIDVFRNGILVATVTGTSYSDASGLSANASYTYIVGARNGDGLRSNSTAVTNYTLANRPAVAPVVLNDTAINVTWTSANPAGTENEVYRNGVFIATTTQNYYVDSGLAATTTYSYVVGARNGAGLRNNSTQANGTTLLAPPPVGWTYTQNPSSGSDVAYSIISDASGGLVVAGRDGVPGNYQWRVLRLFPNGTADWNYTENPTGGSDEARSTKVALDSNGNIYVAGYDSTNGNQWRVRKLFSNGTPDWNYTEDPSGGLDIALSIATDSAGNLYMAGYDQQTGGDRWRVRKILANGTPSWNYSGPANIAYSIAIDSAGSVIVGGRGNVSWEVHKLFPNGTLAWNYSEGTAYTLPTATGVAVDSTGNIYMAGYDNGPGDTQWRVRKLFPNGTADWVYTENPNSTANDYAQAVTVGSDGSIYVAGFEAFGGGERWRVLKLFPNGTAGWVYTENPNASASSNEQGIAIASDSLGNIYIAGRDNDLGNDQWRVVKLTGPVRVVNQSAPACTTGLSYHSTVQGAINAANANDTVLVCAGTYTESVVVNKSVTLRAYNTTYDVTVNSSSGSSDAITVTANNTTITYLTVQNATGINKAGINATASFGNFSYNRLRSNYFGILLSSNYFGASSTTSQNNTVLGNNVTQIVGDGIDLINSHGNVLRRNDISGGSNEGIDVLSSTYNTLEDNVVDNVSVGIQVGAPGFTNSNDNTLRNNTAKNNINHGITVTSSLRNTLINNTATNNSGDGIYLISSSNNTLTNNNASGNSGGFLLSSSSNNTLTGNNISSNTNNGTAITGGSTNNFLNYNNIYANGLYNLNLTQSAAVNATFNWWGTTDCAAINAGIYDYQDNAAYGNVTFEPFLNGSYPGGSAENCAAPPGPPLSIVSVSPLPSPIYEGDSLTFSLNLNQTANVSWYLNGTPVLINTSVTSASYTNTSVLVGTWNVSAFATNANGSANNTWIFTAQQRPLLTVSLNGTPSSLSAPRNTTFTVNATVTCTDPAGATCGRVNGTVRYNGTGTEPNVVIETDVFNGSAVPFRVVDNSLVDLSATDPGNWSGASNFLQLEAVSGGRVFLGLADGKWGLYHRANNTSIDLSTTDPGDWWGSQSVEALAYDSASNVVYLGGGTGAGSASRFGVYNFSTNQTGDLGATDPGDWLGTQRVNSLSRSNSGAVYLTAENGRLGVYYPSNNTTVDLSSTDAGDWVGTRHVYAGAYDPTLDLFYFGGQNSLLGVYNATTNTSTDLPLNGTLAGSILTLAYSPSTDELYIGATGGDVAVFNRTLNQTTNLTPQLPADWAMGPAVSRYVLGVAPDTSRPQVYLGYAGAGGTPGSGFALYNRTTNTSVNLSATDPGDWLDITSVNGLLLWNETEEVYLAADNGRFGVYRGGNPRSCGVLNVGDSCTLNFTVNATGTTSTTWALDVDFRSNNSAVLANNTSNVNVSIGDTTPPSGTSISYTGGYHTNLTRPVDFSNGTDPETGIGANYIQSQTAPLAGGSCGAWSAPATNFTNVSSPQTVSLTQGQCFVIHLNVSNGAGLWTNVSGPVVQVDTTAPAGGSISYLNGINNTGLVAVTFTNASDPESGISANFLDQLQTAFGGGACNTFASNWTNVTSNVSSPYNATGLASGQCYQFKMRTQNGAGTNSSDITSAAVAGVDTAPPSVAINAPASNFPTQSNIAVNATVTETGGSGVSAVTAVLENATGNISASQATLSLSGSYYTGAISIAPVSDGNYTLRVNATDNASNLGTANTTGFSIQIDRAAPATTDNAPAGWSASDVAVTLSVSDIGATTTLYCVDTLNSCTPSTAGTSASVACSSGSVCVRYVRYNSSDAAGNVEPVKSATVRIDKQLPTAQNQAQNLSLVAPGGSVILQAQGNDANELAYAILATNETGTWVNWSGKYGSPMLLGTFGTWTWSNFTWLNSSVSGGTRVGWRIYYNDSAGNAVSTGVLAFDLGTGNPSITGWSNNRTGNNSLDFFARRSEKILFNATSNVSVTWNWSVDGVDQGIAFDNYTASFSTAGAHSVSVVAWNGSLPSAPLTWNVTVSAWVVDRRLFADPNPEYTPSLLQNASGGYWAVWTNNTDTLLYANSTDGSQWASYNTTSTARRPSFIQAANGTYWVAGDGGTPSDLLLYNATGLFQGGAAAVTVYPTSWNDTDPSLLQDSEGTLWVAWTSNRSGNDDIWLSKVATLGNNTTHIQVTTDSLADEAPSLYQDSAGKFWLSWSSFRDGNWEIYVAGSATGAAWDSPPPVRVTSDPAVDDAPALLQDGNLTYWLFWQSTRSGNYDVWYANSSNGMLWSSPAQLTDNSSNDMSPALLQDAAGTYRVAFSSSRDGNWGLWSATLDGKDASPPVLRNVSQASGAVAAGGNNTLQAQARDRARVAYAVLATNETGSWVNWTGQYGSPLFLGNVSHAWTWANFTWQNSSVPAGKTVGWRIYVNDTAGNWGATAEQSFVVSAPDAGYGVALASDRSFRDDVEHNDTAYYNITVTNTGTVFDKFTVAIVSTAASSASLNASLVELPAGASGSVLLSVRDPSSGTFQVVVKATSAADPTRTALAAVTTAFKRVVEVVPDALEKAVNLTETARHNLTVRNTGTRSHTFNLALDSTAASAALNTTSVTVSPDSAKVVQLSLLEVAGTYYSTVTAKDSADPAKSHGATVKTVVATGPVYGVAMAANNTSASVGPGAPAVYALTIRNTGNVPDTYNLTLINTLAGQAQLDDPSPVTLGRGATASRVLTVTESHPGSYPVYVMAVSTNDSSKAASLTLQTTVITYRTVVDAVPASANTTPGNATTYLLRVINLGNAWNSVRVNVTNGTVTNSTLADLLLAPGDRSDLRYVVNNSTAGTYTDTVNVTSLNNTSYVSSVALRTVVSNASIGSATLWVDPPSREVEVGDTATFQVTLANNGNSNRTFSWSVTSGLPLSFDSSAVSLRPGASVARTLSLSAPAAGAYSVKLNATASSVSAEVTPPVRVLPALDLRAEPPTKSVKIGEKAEFHVKLQNKGTKAHNFTLSTGSTVACFETSAGCVSGFTRPFEREEVLSLSLNVTAPAAGLYTIQLNASAQDKPSLSASSNVTLMVEPATVRGVRLGVDQPGLNVRRGVNPVFLLSVTSLGNADDSFRFDAQDVEGGTVSFEKPNLSLTTLRPQGQVIVTMVPSADSARVRAVLRAVSENDPDVESRVEVGAKLLPDECETQTYLSTVVDSRVCRFSILGSSVQRSAIEDSSIINSEVRDSVVRNSTVIGSTVSDNTVLVNSTVVGSTVLSSLVSFGGVTDSLMEFGSLNSKLVGTQLVEGSLKIGNRTFTAPADLTQVLKGSDQKKEQLAAATGSTVSMNGERSQVQVAITADRPFLGGTMEILRSSVKPAGIDNGTAQNGGSDVLNGNFVSIDASNNVRNSMTVNGARVRVYYDTLPDGIDTSTLKLKKFNETTKTWVELENVTHNSTGKYLEGLTRNFSVFAVAAAALTACANCGPVVPAAPSVSGGGGGGVPASPPPKKFLFQAALEAVTPSVSLDLYQGETTTTKIRVRNNLDTSASLRISVQGDVVPFLRLKQDALTLPANQEGTFDLDVSIPAEARSTLYAGVLRVESEKFKTEIPVNIRVLRGAAQLLDLKVTPLKDEVAPGSSLAVEAAIFNPGEAGRASVNLTVQLQDPDTQAVKSSVEDRFSVEAGRIAKILTLDVPAKIEEKRYMVKGVAVYRASEEKEVVSIAFVNVATPFWSRTLLGVSYMVWAAGAAAASGGTGALAYGLRRRRLAARKARYVEMVDVKELPAASDAAAFVGTIGESGMRAFFRLDDLMTHAMVAGATGGGKTVAAQVLVEEALRHGKSVIVFDPTAQWTGFLRKCEDHAMLSQYKEFGMKEPKGFDGRIKVIEDPREKINVKELLAKPGITVFALNKIQAGMDTFVANTVREVFAEGLTETKELKALMVYDEVHRLLTKFGGKGEGFLQIERGAREFRKWGIGLVLVSQVTSDFLGEIKANIGMEVQMRTRFEEDLDRIKMKYGEDLVPSVVRAEVGTGMVAFSQYNRGRPYFVRFRPLLHSTTRLSDEELEKYARHDKVITDAKFQASRLKEMGVDAFDIETELDLAESKLMKGQFEMIDIYMESVEASLKREWRKRGEKPAERAKELVSDEEIRKSVEEAKAEREKVLKGAPAKFVVKSIEDKIEELKLSLERSKAAGKDTYFGEVELSRAASDLEIVKATEEEKEVQKLMKKIQDIEKWMREGL